MDFSIVHAVDIIQLRQRFIIDRIAWIEIGGNIQVRQKTLILKARRKLLYLGLHGFQ